MSAVLFYVISRDIKSYESYIGLNIRDEKARVDHIGAWLLENYGQTICQAELILGTNWTSVINDDADDSAVATKSERLHVDQPVTIS